MRKRLLRFLASSVIASGMLAQAPKQPPTPVPGSAPKQNTPATMEATFLKITIDPSRSPITMDTEAGVSAEIKNVSTVPVTIFENETIFMTTPETRLYGESQQAIQGCATFPTQGNVRPPKRPDRGYELLIQPGDSYRVFWDMTRNGCTGERLTKLRLWDNRLAWFEEKWQRVMFTPGTYKLYLNVVLHPPEGQPYRTTTEGREVLISASQQMVLFGAFLGGLLAYLLKIYYGVETLVVRVQNARLKRIIQRTEWLIAGLFGAAMVILASRLSETFPIKVNANDFWGSITLGFIFQWMGVKLLEKLPGMDSAAAASRADLQPPGGSAP